MLKHESSITHQPQPSRHLSGASFAESQRGPIVQRMMQLKAGIIEERRNNEKCKACADEFGKYQIARNKKVFCGGEFDGKLF